MAIAQMLKQEMDERRLNMSQVAEILGVKQPTVGRWLIEQDAPSDRHAEALAAFLGTTVGEVLEAIFRQRQSKRTLADRLADAEATIEELRDQVSKLTRELQRAKAAARRIQTADGAG